MTRCCCECECISRQHGVQQAPLLCMSLTTPFICLFVRCFIRFAIVKFVWLLVHSFTYALDFVGHWGLAKTL